MYCGKHRRPHGRSQLRNAGSGGAEVGVPLLPRALRGDWTRVPCVRRACTVLHCHGQAHGCRRLVRHCEHIRPIHPPASGQGALVPQNDGPAWYPTGTGHWQVQLPSVRFPGAALQVPRALRRVRSVPHVPSPGRLRSGRHWHWQHRAPALGSCVPLQIHERRGPRAGLQVSFLV